MSSKLDYLKKYAAGGNDDPDKKKRKKRPVSSHYSKIEVKDDEEDANKYHAKNVSLDNNSLWDVGIEEAPVIVETTEERQVSRGTWTAIAAEQNSRADSRRRPAGSDDESPPRRAARLDNNCSSPPRRQRARHDSDNDASPPRRARHDCDDDAGPPRRTVVESPSDKGYNVEVKKELAPSSNRAATVVEKRKKTASGHDAGLQTGAGFGRTEKEMKARRDEEIKNADPSLQGAGQETVYRDRKGKKLDMLSEFMRQQAVREGKEFKIEKAQTEWGKGTVQKLEVEALRQELADVASEPFARTIEHTGLEAMRKGIMRDGDPMAEYFARKKEKEEEEKALKYPREEDTPQIAKKPRYKGPVGAPNRFHIFPGYRWDGIDRGNRYEHKILTKSNDRAALKEDEYRWSVADM